MKCPLCNKNTKHLRCTNTKCRAYSSKVIEEEVEEIDESEGHTECYECEGAGMWMVCYGGMPTEKKCKVCFGTGVLEE